MLVNTNNVPKKIKKDGTEGKHRDLSLLRTVGNIVNTNYGMFTILNSFKQNKVWYVTITDTVKTLTIKLQQLFNKKLPKTGKVTDTLLLQQPKELIDQLVQQANTQIKLRNSQHSDSTEPTWEETLQNSDPSWLNDPVNLFQIKLELIAGGIATGLPNAMSIYRQLVQYYHPDHNNDSCTELFELIGDFRHMI